MPWWFPAGTRFRVRSGMRSVIDLRLCFGCACALRFSRPPVAARQMFDAGLRYERAQGARSWRKQGRFDGARDVHWWGAGCRCWGGTSRNLIMYECVLVISSAKVRICAGRGLGVVAREGGAGAPLAKSFPELLAVETARCEALVLGA